MTDFDKLIKEKAEQAEYSYKPSAWRSFQRKSGLGHTATKYWVAGLTSVIAVGGVIAFSSYRHSQTSQEAEPTQTFTVADTLACDQDITTTANADTFVVSKSETSDPVIKHPSENKKQEPVDTKVVAPESHSVPTQQIKKTPRYGRPIVIDVDTIKENVPSDEELKNGNSRII